MSHLRNLKASANPDKEHAKQQLGFINTNKNYPYDIRKYSYNNEFSYSIDALGLGTATESNVIYSQNSFLPRSTKWNMTTELFGHTLNFLEIDTRQENFDKLLEHYFGPLGVIRSKETEDLFEEGGNALNKILNKLQERVKTTRGKRDVTKEEINSINKQVQIKTNELNNDLDLDLSIKLFGSELLFLSLNDDIKKFTPEALINKLFDNVDTTIDQVKNFEHVARTNTIFLDAELSYPTSTGFPLKMGVEGVSSLHLESKGSIDVRALVNNKDNIFKLTLIPSVNVQINGRFTVDAYFLESGLKTSTNIHTATGSGLEISFFNSNKGLDAKISFPLKKHELISATHDVLLHNRELGVQETNVPLKFGDTKPFEVCVDHLSNIIGLNFCVDLIRPNVASNDPNTALPFPFDGKTRFAVTVENEDLSHVHVRSVNNYYDGDTEFLIETIGNNKNKKASFEMQLHLRPEMYAKIALVSPIRNSEIEGRIVMEPNERSVTLKLDDMDKKYFGKLGVSITDQGSKKIYKPLLDYQLPNVQRKFFFFNKL